MTLYIGFISAGIAISLREIFTNIVSWMIIIVQKPFEVGDRISVNGKSGDVIDLKLFHFVVMDVMDKEYGEQSTGRISHIPNNYIFLHQLTNASKGFGYVWHEIEIGLTQDSDWEKAKEEVYKIVHKHNLHQVDEAQEKVIKASKKYMLYYNNLTPIIYVSYKGGHVILTLRYLSKPRQCRVTENLIWSEILVTFKSIDTIELT
jgi:small-conductance mechanosensitive channel